MNLSMIKSVKYDGIWEVRPTNLDRDDSLINHKMCVTFVSEEDALDFLVSANKGTWFVEAAPVKEPVFVDVAE